MGLCEEGYGKCISACKTWKEDNNGYRQKSLESGAKKLEGGKEIKSKCTSRITKLWNPHSTWKCDQGLLHQKKESWINIILMSLMLPEQNGFHHSILSIFCECLACKSGSLLCTTNWSYERKQLWRENENKEKNAINKKWYWGRITSCSETCHFKKRGKHLVIYQRRRSLKHIAVLYSDDRWRIRNF